MTAIDLSGSWRLRDGLGEFDLMIELPNDIHSALTLVGVLAEPYEGRNEYDARWVADRDWILSRDVELPHGPLDWVVEGLDCVAELMVNGEVIGRFENAFRAHRAQLCEEAREGLNHLEIRFPSQTAEANARQAAQPFPVPYHPGNSPIPNGNMLRKPQCDFGWDWNIALVPFGVYGDMRIERRKNLRMDQVKVFQDHSADDGSVRVTVEIATVGIGRGVAGVIFDGQAASVPLHGGSTGRAEFVMNQPLRWWPAGYGPQKLYDLAVSFDGEKVNRRIGLRKVDLNSRDGFTLSVNDQPIFAKGANWIPADALAGRIDRDAVRAMLQSAVDANMNMIRVWGGGRYEPDWFYAMCDELGLMVWQDFMFACNLYPSDQAFLDEVYAEVCENVARMQSHPSIVLWCGDNELVGALNWFEESRNDRDRYLVAYDRLNRTVQRGLHETDPQAIWWPSSPSKGPLDFGDAWHDDSAGDMHFWSVWHEGRDFDHYRDVSPRFCSEFGFQSYPSMDVIRRFADRKDFNIAAPVLESHQKNAGGNARIAETMFRYFRFPVGFENFVYLSQVQQALAIKTAVTHWRSLKPHCMGTLYWQLNDTWPVASWSSLDHGGGWKLLHHAAKSFYAPTLVTVVPDGDAFRFVGINDGPETADVNVRVWAMSTDGGMRDLARISDSLGVSTSQILARITASDVAESEILVWETTGAEGQPVTDHFAPNPYKSYDLKSPNIDLRQAVVGDELLITLTAQAPALFVSLEANVAGRFSDNGMTLLPNQPYTVKFTPAGQGDVTFTLRDLHSATYED